MAADEFFEDRTQSFIPLTNGTMVSHYQLIKKIGAGGMGEVYLAEDTKLNRKVALKFLPPHLCRDENCRKRFTREAQAAAGLDHPNIAAIYDVGEYQGSPFYSMQVVEGNSLRDVIAGNDLPIEKILKITIQVCEGLQAAHDKGIVHRDIKPSNILLDDQGRVRIVDFGLAAIRGSEHLTTTGATLGTIGYMSPEQIQGKNTDHRSDLFSLGVVLYEMITGRLPFRGDTDTATMNTVLNEVPEPLSRYKSGVSEKLQDVVSKLLEKDPSLRYQGTIDLIGDFKRLANNQASAARNEITVPSIAVLPFTNLSADPEQEYFCDGMAEEIINALAHVEGLRVVARTSCFAFKGKHEDIRGIGRKLNVDHVLEGSVRKSGNRVRITGQLVKVADGYHLWSDKFDRDLEDIFEIQDEISVAIANNLDARLRRREDSRIPKRHTIAFDAYGLYLRARWLFDQRTERSIRESIDCYTQAIAQDPNFARAYVGLSYSYCELPQFSSFSQKDALNKARQAAEKALELDDRLAEAHTALGVILAEFDWNWTKAEAEYLKAIDLSASSAETRFWYSLLLLYLARMDDAMQQMKLAQELDPLSLAINKYLGLIYLCAGHYKEGEKTLKNTIEMAPGMTFPHGMLGLLFIEKEMFAEALSHFQEEEKNAEEVPSMITAWKTIALIAVGRVSEAHDLLKLLEEKYDQNQASPYAVAAAHFALANPNRGFEWLARAADERDYWLRYLKVDPTLRNMREDPRFRKLLNRIGLE